MEYNFSTVPAFFGVEAELNGTQKLVFGMIITDPEHWRLWFKWQEYSSIIAQWTPYKSYNAKRGWFVWVCDVIILQAYSHHFFKLAKFKTRSLKRFVFISKLSLFHSKIYFRTMFIFFFYQSDQIYVGIRYFPVSRIFHEMNFIQCHHKWFCLLDV